MLLDPNDLLASILGELVPHAPRDDPASELFDRIHATREKLDGEKNERQPMHDDELEIHVA